MMNLFFSNLFTIPIFSFVFGGLFSFLRKESFFSKKFNSFLTLFLLFSIGLKGGISLVGCSSCRIFYLLGLLVLWGLIQPFFSYWILRKFTKIDSMTAAAISACFGSISLMTYVAAATFLEKLGIQYEGLIVAALAIMEIPAIISGLFLAKSFKGADSRSRKGVLAEAIFNKTVLFIFAGMAFGFFCYLMQWKVVPDKIFLLFKPFLCLFLFNMGWLVGRHREDLGQFSWSLSLFGLYMPLIGGAFGIFLSSLFHLDVGTGTLIAVLSASASYIAAPAAMRVALPEAKEAVYLPLSLGVAFPFNVVVGIPLYYQAALKFLG